jgi:hypothetical protein
MLPMPMMPGQQVSAIREWENLMRQIGALAEQALDLAQGRAERIYQINQLDAVIEATGHGEMVGDSGYTREGAKASRAFILWFVAGAQEEILVDVMPDGAELRMSPLAILSARAGAS